jgi:hypothetical protein
LIILALNREVLQVWRCVQDVPLNNENGVVQRIAFRCWRERSCHERILARRTTGGGQTGLLRNAQDKPTELKYGENKRREHQE